MNTTFALLPKNSGEWMHHTSFKNAIAIAGAI
jgi:hypothetical protein